MKDAVDLTSDHCHKFIFMPHSSNCPSYYFPATTNLENGLVQKSDVDSLIEASLFAMGVVLVILLVFSFFQIFLSGLFPAVGLRSARRQDEDTVSLLSNFLFTLNNRYLVYSKTHFVRSISIFS